MKHLSDFSGRLLNAFITLVDCGQFKLAAERCNVSQSVLVKFFQTLR
ncbi:LysR family transcriptional regulator [Variovorax rhizosphaerae]|uniref:LysR family transcriptional regulator n=1 Tax=Variovorax rhizosphaerae TaxID=1836200 RepID=A0ABU8WUR3_9BURK